MDSKIGKHFSELASSLLAVDRNEIDKAVDILDAAREKRASVWIMGNGGSAATASHFANDLNKMAGIKAFSVPDMVPTMTAFGNDHGWERMFQFTIDAYLEPEDVLVAISCSGNSKNVVKAAKGIENLIVLTGNDYRDNTLANMRTKALLIAPHDEITVQEDIHLAMCHAIAKELRL